MSGEWQCPGCNYETEARCDDAHIYDCLVENVRQRNKFKEALDQLGKGICDWCWDNASEREDAIMDKIHLNEGFLDGTTGKLVTVCDGCYEASEPL